MRTGAGRRAAVSCLALLALPRPAAAQAVFEQFNLQFSFATPGARAKGMGGAFVAIADDASASEMNPGGLALALRLPPAQGAVLMAFSAVPTASSAYVLAARMGYNGPFVAGLVTLSTLLGMLSLPFALSLPR